MDINQYREKATAIVVDGLKAKASDDDIKMNLMGVGVPYSALNTVVKTIAIEEGLLVDPKVVTTELNEKIEQVDWEAVGDWDTLADYGTKLAESVDGATFARAITLTRAYCKNEMDLALPKKPRSAGGGGKGRVGAIAQAVCDLIAENASPTKQEFYDAMIPVVGGDQQHANIIYYMGLHQAVAMTVAAGGDKTLTEITAELAQQANPTPGEGVSAVPRGESAPVETEAEAETDEGEYDDEAEEDME